MATTTGGGGLRGTDFIKDVLAPIQLVIWGELAMKKLGVRTMISVKEYMFGVVDDNMNLAIRLLLDAGFMQQTWPFSSSRDPASFAGPDYEDYCRIQELAAPGYAKITRASIRFHHPDKRKVERRIIILPSSYIHMNIPSSQPITAHTTDGAQIFAESMYPTIDNLNYPDAPTLLESFVKVLLEDDSPGSHWRYLLKAWIISYMYGHLSPSNDVLDGSKDDAVREWWDKAIDRDSGGLDMRITKHDGKDW